LTSIAIPFRSHLKFWDPEVTGVASGPTTRNGDILWSDFAAIGGLEVFRVMEVMIILAITSDPAVAIRRCNSRGLV